ncbi:hypothetical protein [Lysinibacillus capsici]|uniref:capsular polysaccharide export protein, LipB/KpsS family n=1 Tax=Lysinibacillus capsici TaxID=2115968 RepID=UPI000E1FDD55|nr:hypothetical protein [Lysinibacillus capsici]RDV28847.1 hypothetical protein C7B89_18240 [Lysinibacillus capsici]
MSLKSTIHIEKETSSIICFLRNSDKINVWGTGNLFNVINEYFDFTLLSKVNCFIETSPNKTSFLDRPVIDIYTFIANKREIEILICSSYKDEIIEKLKSINAEVLIKVYIADELLSEIPLSRYQKGFYQFLNNDSTLLQETINGKKIGIYIHHWKGWIAPYYCLALGILLKKKGMDVRFIFEDINDKLSIDFEKYEREIRILLEKIKIDWGIPYDSLSEITGESLTVQQTEEINSVIDFSMISYTRKVLDYNEKELEVYKKIKINLYTLAEKFNHYFEINKFDTVFAITNLHYSLGCIEKICSGKNIHTTSAELMRGGFSYSITGPAVQQNDISIVINLLNEEEKKRLLRVSEEYLSIEIGNEFKRIIKNEYVLIPLNIFWDSAAYANNDIFNNNIWEWLNKTISFILKNTNLSIVVRQHPHEEVFQTGNDLKKYLIEEFGEEERFIFIGCKENISSYNLVKFSKIVLPNTSTIGLESICMGKTVITKSCVYYADSNFCVVSKSENDYYSNILEFSNKDIQFPDDNLKLAKLYLALSLLNRIKTKFTHHYSHMDSWLSKESLETLEKECEYNGVFDVFLKRIPALYTQINNNIIDNNYK